MNPIAYTLKGLSPIDYYKKHLEIVTLFLPGEITKTEILVLASFMSLKGDIVKEDRFCTSARKIIMKDLGMVAGGLGNHLKSLRDKKYIYKDENGKFQINKYLIPDNDILQGYQFKITTNG